MYRRAVRVDVPIDFLCPPCESAVEAQDVQHQTSGPANSTLIPGAQTATAEPPDVSVVPQYDDDNDVDLN